MNKPLREYVAINDDINMPEVKLRGFYVSARNFIRYAMPALPPGAYNVYERKGAHLLFVTPAWRRVP